MSRRVFLALLLPGVVVGVYWISAAWMSDTYDTARSAKVVIAAFYAMVLVGLLGARRRYRCRSRQVAAPVTARALTVCSVAGCPNAAEVAR
jgi:peptidoglycan/LPS O-acetylase OafA/YrhL